MLSEIFQSTNSPGAGAPAGAWLARAAGANREGGPSSYRKHGKNMFPLELLED